MNSRAIDRLLHIQGFKSPCDITMEQVPLRVVFGPDAAGTSKLLEAVVQEALGGADADRRPLAVRWAGCHAVVSVDSGKPCTIRPAAPRMRIDSLLLENVKGFKSRELAFHPQFNLVVGENGTGKTSLLDALAVAVGSWFLGISGVDTRQIYHHEVRLQAFTSEAGTHWEGQYPCVIEARGFIAHASYLWRRSLTGPGGRTTRIGASEIKKLAEQAAHAVREGQAIHLPLIAYYGPGRLWQVPREQGQVKEPPHSLLNKKLSRLDGYKTSVDLRLSVSALTQGLLANPGSAFSKAARIAKAFKWSARLC